MKRVVVLGSTGSIGRNVLEVVNRHPEAFEVVGLAAHRNLDLLRAQCAEHPHARVVVTDESCRATVEAEPSLRQRCIGFSEAALPDLAVGSDADLIVNALVGFVGLQPTLAALTAGIPVAVANKESIVAGGEVMLRAARASGAAVVPIDSEHVAIAQCLQGARLEDVDRVILTASGGSLRDRKADDLYNAPLEAVLAHPTWNMGAKITVDSATLMNKGLEIIEAHWLFGLPYSRIEVVIHPQSIVHSVVRFVDGSMLAQMGKPDMRLPILYALSYPERIKSDLGASLLEFPSLSFAPVDDQRYPCYRLAVQAARAGGTAPTVLSAANEIAVAAFLDGKLSFGAIPGVIAAALDAIPVRSATSLDDVMEADRATRRWIREHHDTPAARSGRQ
ncbi:MAG TPA: 1-deoxy-D-xylulose-5-phosphate reductoisomerase [Candidatus Krumholzibacteria bacterium]|nr:1-deoxy-D-xylulose-5-phosphate reductoisomerase [Candidatus Krumholzibacteria bacterium]